MRRIVQMVVNLYQFCHFSRDLVHLILRHTAVFQCKCDILTHGQPDKLSVRILQNRPNMGGKFKDTAFGGIHAIDDQLTGRFAGIGIGIQSVDAARQRTFSAAGRTCDQHPFSRIDIQIDIC